MTKKLWSLLFLVVLGLGLTIGSYINPKSVKADTGDQWASFNGSGASVGTVITAVSGSRIIIKEMIITCTNSLTVVPIEHPATGSDINWPAFGVLANTPFPVPPSFFNGSYGWALGSGSALRVENQNLAAGTLTISVRYSN